MTKVVLLGYGQMGREIDSIAKEFDVEIVAKLDLADDINDLDKIDFDVAIDFTIPMAVEDNFRKVISLGKSIVIGTTGWYDKLDRFRELAENSNGSCLWGSNFSIGMQTFYRLIANAGSLIDKLDEYDVSVHEIHHRRKKDSPSGSALAIANILLENVDRKTRIKEETCHEEIDKNSIHVSSSRIGAITGTHTVYMDSKSDTIELTHRAKNRRGLAKGALVAAKWLAGKKGFYTFSDVLDEIMD